MATFDRPSLVPTWAENNQTNVDQPPDSLRAVGYVADEVPMAEHLNWLFWMLGNWVGYLDQANAATVMATTLDVNTRLVQGGNWAYDANTKTLSWDMAAALLIPSIPLSDNVIAAGSVILGEDVVAYVQANVPYTTSGALKSGDTHVQNVAHPAAISVGWTVTGTGIPPSTTVTAINDSTLTLSQAATATNTTAVLTFAGSTALTVQASPATSLLPNPNTVIIAVGKESSCIVGANSGQMVVRHKESKRLLGSGYVSTMTALAGQGLAANTPVYISQGSSDGRTAGSVYACDASSANGAQRGQFIGFTMNAFASGATAHVVSAGIVNGFSGLTVGQVYYLDPSSPGGIVTTRPTAVGVYVVPLGCAITATSLRINPAATNALTAIQSGLNVNGFLVVRPGATGNAVQLYSADGTTLVASITDAGLATVQGLSSSGAITSGATVTGKNVVSQSGFKSVLYAGGYVTQSVPNQANFQRVIHNDSTGNPSYEGCIYTMTHPGSVVGLAGTVYCRNVGSIQTAVTIAILSRGQPIYQFNVGSVNQDFNLSFPRGVYSFNAGDTIYVAAANLVQGNLFNGRAFMTIELNA